MKILFLTPWYPDEERPNSGIFIKAQAIALAQRHEVSVVAFRVDYTKRAFHAYNSSTVKSNNLTEHKLTVVQSLPLYNQINFLYAAYKFAREKSTTFHPNIIHASIGYPGAVVACLLSQKLKVPFVFTEHTKPTNNFRSLWHKVLTRKAVKKSSAVMAVGQRLASEIHHEYGKAATVIPNIVDVEKFTNVKTSNESVYQLGFIGGMNTNVKGLDLLLTAISRMKIPVNLHICGSGTLFETYRRQARDLGISERCKFYGFVNPIDMPGFFAKIHTLICSSRYETFNVSLVEAMACGLPVVSTKCGGPEDFVSEINGVLCENGNAEALKDAIEHLLDNYSKFESERIRDSALRFSAPTVVPKLENVYLTVLNRAN